MDREKLSEKFVEGSKKPKTDKDWDAVFKEAMEMMVEGVKPAIAKADEAKIPREIMIMQLFTIAVDGLIYQGWTRMEAVSRLIMHKWPEEEMEMPEPPIGYAQTSE